MSANSVLLMFAVACSSILLASSRKMTADRDLLIDSAIAEVKQEFATMQEMKLSKAQEKLHDFKKATPEAMAEGLASQKFERMVKLAEKKILKNQRLAGVQSKSAIAEALATELMHKPGSILTTQEIAIIYQASDCLETLLAPPSCDSPQVMNRRTADGSCNNLANPLFGASRTALRRLIPAQYDDGISRPRGFLQSQGSPLINGGVFNPPIPSARIASTSVVGDRPDTDSRYSLILMQWGQFMDHDIDVVPEHGNNCPEGCAIPDEFEGSCYPFAVPADDANIEVTRTGPGSTSCFQFRRSLGACPVGGEEPMTAIPPREHLNLITHLVDGSMVYGHTDAIMNQLRDPASNGLLRTGTPAPDGSGRPLLPDADENSFVLCPPGLDGCVVAGDLRVNEQVALTIMHTIWLREHNRIAGIIGNDNPALTPDEVFFTARDIVIAEIQKIAYEDYLPILLGDGSDTLIPPYESYDDKVNPNVPNSFAAAAFRYGHSQIQPFFERLNEAFESIPEGPLSLVEAFFNTMEVREAGVNPLLRGLLTSQIRRTDEFLNDFLTNHLFASDVTSPGLDLASINIQRGRDHGLPPYLIWKQWAKRRCGVESEFGNELTEVHLLQTYGSLESVDLFVGGLAETPLPGGVLGAVFGCILADTFSGLRNGDRFYYENTDATALFNRAQREEIGKASLSRVICDNTEITQIQENAFLAGQPRLACSEIPSVNLSAWTVATDDRCFIKVGSTPAGNYFSVSRLLGVPARPLFQGRPEPGSDSCYRILCPRGSVSTLFAVVSGQNFRCAPQVNPNLKPSTSAARNTYLQTLTLAEFEETGNGIYTNFGDCQAQSSPNALDYNCARPFAGLQHDAGKSVLIESNSLDEIREQVGDDLMREMFGDAGATSSNADKLIHLMEEMLKEMKSAKVSVSVEEQKEKGPAGKAKAADVDSDGSLASELEDLLKELQ